jgi:hypothetical protein
VLRTVVVRLDFKKRPDWRTFLVPLTHAGLVIFARNGMALAVDIRDTQLSGAVRPIDWQSDMCGVWCSNGR